MVTTLIPTIRQTTTTSTIVTSSTTTQLTTTASGTVASSSPGVISPGYKHLSSTLSTSSSPCTDLPRHLCSNLISPPPLPAHLLVTSNLTKESLEQQLLSSCIANGPSTNLREVVRAVLERLPWTDQSSLRDKSAILATAFSIMPIIAGLESFKLDNKMLVRLVPPNLPLAHEHYLETAFSEKLEERKKLLLEVTIIIMTTIMTIIITITVHQVATIIHTKQAGPGREESEMAGCR